MALVARGIGSAMHIAAIRKSSHDELAFYGLSGKRSVQFAPDRASDMGAAPCGMSSCRRLRIADGRHHRIVGVAFDEAREDCGVVSIATARGCVACVAYQERTVSRCGKRPVHRLLHA